MALPFAKPYPHNFSVRSQWMLCIGVSLFITLFLFVFRPFGLYNLSDNAGMIILGYGVCCLLSMVFLNILCPLLFPSFFTEQHWTVGRELFWVLLNIALIGLANTIYSNLIGLFSLNIVSIMVFELYTLAIGFIPVSFLVLRKQSVMNRQFQQQSLQINDALRYEEPVKDVNGNVPVRIPSQNVKELLELKIADLLFIKAADNYVEVCYLEGSTPVRKLLRNALTDVAAALESYPQCFRCHKSYLVNLSHVQSVSGNAQGLKLHLLYVEDPVPVSRNLSREIKNRLALHP